MRRHNRMLTLAIASAILLTGCATATAAEAPTPPGTTAEPGTSHSHEPATTPSEADTPSEAAQMICSPDIQDSVAAALGLTTAPVPEDTFSNGVYTCTYPVSDGALVLSVMEMADDASAKAHAAELRTTFDSAEDIVGLANLGLPAYETPDGIVLFVKDNMMLQVDAREVPMQDGQGEASRTGIAYRIATNVLACWKTHS